MIAVPPAPAVSLTVSPERVTLAPLATRDVDVLNAGTRALVADVSAAGYRLDARGRPLLGAVGPRWFTVLTHRVSLAAGGHARVRIVARGAGAPPGDHTEALLLTSHQTTGSVPVRMRVGVVVVVHVPGRVRRRLVLGTVRAVGHGRARRLVLAVANRGDVDEWQPAGRVVLRIARRGRAPRFLRAAPRRFLAHSRGLLEFHWPGGAAARAEVRLQVAAQAWWIHPARRRFTLRL